MPPLPPTEFSLAFERVGSGPQPILFVHGSFASSRWWQPVAALLPADEITCYLPDLCGCGRSPRSEDPASYRVEQQVADLSALIEQLDLFNLHLVGHSLGAAIALTYAAADPTRLRSLTLVSTPSPTGTPTPPEGYELLERMRGDRGLLSQALASIMPARAPDAFFQQLVDDAQGQAPAAFTAYGRGPRSVAAATRSAGSAPSARVAHVGRSRIRSSSGMVRRGFCWRFPAPTIWRFSAAPAIVRCWSEPRVLCKHF